MASQPPHTASLTQIAGSRQGKRVESVNNLVNESQVAIKVSKSGKTKKDIRPLSGGVSKVIKGTN